MLGLKTKDITPKLDATTIPVINHENIDRVAAEALVDAGVCAVVNAAGCSTGHYPNLGPLVMARSGIYILDNVGLKVFDRLKKWRRDRGSRRRPLPGRGARRNRRPPRPRNR